ncbi:hypothetical protein B0J14DRAFT_642676 [Halenospora varia]|nr:hypothetical protein B0J14DRAFT_642676 [Halenospora varia]
MGIQVNGIAFWLDRTHVAVSEDHSYIFISYENQIIVFHINPTDSQYEARFRHTAKGKVTSPSWSGDDICYKIEGDSKEQRVLSLSRYEKAIKNTVSESTALIFLKWRGINAPEDQIMDLQELFRGKLVLEEVSQHQDMGKLYIEKLPYEEVRQEILSMSIGAAEDFVELHLNSIEEKERVLRERCDPLLFLGELFEDPERLLDLMRCTGAVITGSRAAAYFCPGACVVSSDVDFFCPSDIETVALFTYHLNLMGVKWISFEPLEKESQVEFLDYYSKGFNLLRGILHHKEGKIDVQCVWSANHHRTASSNIFGFHSTLVQCFISGFAAVSLYDKYTSARQTIHWEANDPNTASRQRHRKYIQPGVLSVKRGEVEEYMPSTDNNRNERKIFEKYSGRGFEFVKYFSQGKLAHGYRDEIGPYGSRIRSVGDSGCRIVSFKPYLKHDDWHIPFDVYDGALRGILWGETKYKTTPMQGIHEDDFPYRRESRTPFDKEWSGPNQIFDPMESPYATELTNGNEAIKTPWFKEQVFRYEAVKRVKLGNYDDVTEDSEYESGVNEDIKYRYESRVIKHKDEAAGDEKVFLRGVEKFFYSYRYPC